MMRTRRSLWGIETSRRARLSVRVPPVPVFRPYRPADRDACLALFDANCPEWFAPDERAGYETFLAAVPGGYEVVECDGAIAAAFGVLRPAETWHLNWIMVSPAVHGRGIGRAIVARARDLLRDGGGSTLHIAASHKSAPFFAKFGAREVGRIPDGWGPGMHRVDMVLAGWTARRSLRAPVSARSRAR